MKKLRCESCNGDLTVDDKKEFATCNYCGTKYKLNDDMTINIKFDDTTKEVLNTGLKAGKTIAKAMIIPLIIFAIVFVTVVVLIVKGAVSSSNNFDKSRFNNQFIFKNGTQYKTFVDTLIDDINESNKKNDKHQVVLVYKDKEVTSSDDLVNLKHSLKNMKYEVIFNYDDKGYINKIVIEDVN